MGRLPADMPWDLILRLTSFGGAECTNQTSHWWTRHVLWPCQRTEASARTYLQEVEGTHLLHFPEGFSAVDGAAPRPRNHRGRGPANRAGPYKKPPHHDNSNQQNNNNNNNYNKGGKGKGKGKDNKNNKGYPKGKGKSNK